MSHPDWKRAEAKRQRALNYTTAKREAQRMADATGLDVGVSWQELTQEYRVSLLPGVNSRFGCERTCEVVHCTNLAKCRPGHGPLAKVTP